MPTFKTVAIIVLAPCFPSQIGQHKRVLFGGQQDDFYVPVCLSL
jgi:hypothetical protein